jgi:hypothetical protein
MLVERTHTFTPTSRFFYHACRMIGHFAKLIKSMTHPEENLVNRHLRSCATRGVGFTASRVAGGDAAEMHADGEDEIELSDDPHPLVRQDASNSMVDATRVVWPRANSRNCKGKADVAEHEDALAELLRMLGPEICDKFIGKCPSFTLQPMLSPVRKGHWLLGLKEREDKRAVSKTISSWFSILSARVPHYTVPLRSKLAHQHPLNPILYGRIQSFVEVIVPAWSREPFRLAKVSLYAGDHCEQYTRFHCINTLAPLISSGGVALTYVQVKDVLSTVAVAPLHQGHFFILPIVL